MTTEINEEIVDAIQSTTMLIRLATSSFGTERTDRSKSDEVTSGEGATRDAARVVVNRLPGPAKHHHNRVVKMQSSARELVNQYTTPWDETGWRMLSTSSFDALMRQLHPLNEQFRSALADYTQAAPQVLKDAVDALGGLASGVTMPSAEDMIKAYDMRVDIVPVPDGANFRGLPPNAKEILGQRLKKQIAASFEKGVASIIERLQPMLNTAVERLTAYDNRLEQQARGVEVGRHGAFRDTLISNFHPVLDLLTALEGIGDPRLAELKTRVEEIVEASPEQLRTDDQVRATTKARAKATLDVLDQWGV